MFVIGIIDSFKERQEKIKCYKKITHRDKDVLNKMPDSLMQMYSFCVAMDNYFTLTKVISVLREKNIGVVRISRFRRNLASEELQKNQPEKVDFNNFYYCVDKH